MHMQTSGQQTYGAHGAASGRRGQTPLPERRGANAREGRRGNGTEQSYCKTQTCQNEERLRAMTARSPLRKYLQQEAHGGGHGEQLPRGNEASKEALTTFLSNAH